MKHRVDGFMAYGCDCCGKGFRMYLEAGLEELNDGPMHKPVPFFIKCPFCGGSQCHDLAFRKYRLKQPMNPKGIPYFANRRDQNCGVPTNMDCAKVEFTRGEGKGEGSGRYA